MIFRAKSKFPINSWAGRMRGEVAFIIGNGPSLLENDLRLIDDYFTIGINRAFKIILPKILIWQDESLYSDCYEDIVKLPCAKLTKESIDPNNQFTHFALERGSFRFGGNPAILYGGGSTAALSIQLAVAMGFSSIVILGCDCGYKNGKTDFYGTNKNHTATTVDNFLAAMFWASRECPIPIVNCGDAPYWPRVGLDVAIGLVQPIKRHHFEWLNRLT